MHMKTAEQIFKYSKIIAGDLPYYIYFYYYAFKGLLQTQNIKLPDQKLSFSESFQFSQEVKNNWDSMFQIPFSKKDYKITYYWKTCQKSYMICMNSLQFDYKNIRHLAHERFFPNPKLELKVGETYTVECGFSGVVPLNHDRVIFIIEVECRNLKNMIVSRQKDFIFLKGVDKKSLKRIKAHPLSGYPIDFSLFRSLSSRKPRLKKYKTEPLFLPEYFGIYYGLVSGDMNPVHTSSTLAKLFGIKKPFLQGVGTANLILKTLTYNLKENIKNIQTIFTQPIYLDQTVFLRHTKNDFEVVDKNGLLLAFGKKILHS